MRTVYLASRAARLTAALVVTLSTGYAVAQDEPVPADEAPAEQPAPASEETTPAAETAAPAEGQSAPEPEAIPVQTGEAEAAPESTELDAIEVTGSRIKRTDYETAQPVAVVTREDIERTGLTNIGDILQRIPAAGSALNRNFNNGGNGQTEIDLRNLGSNRLLVLVNGHRWVVGTSFANLSAVDLNTIPVSIIERIEVLKDGASAVYGSDAISGVVNIITRKEFSGAELGAQAQSFEDGEGLIHAYNASFGNVLGKTSLFANISYVVQEPMFADARDRSAVPKYGTGLSRGSIFTPLGTVVFVPTPENASALGEELCPTILGGRTGTSTGLPEETGGQTVTVPGTGATPVPTGVQLCDMILIRGQTITGDPSETTATVRDRYRFFGGLAGIGDATGDDPDKYNYAPINYLLTPFTQRSLFTQINHAFLDNLNFSSQILYNVSLTERYLAETPLLFGQGLGIPPPYDAVYIDATQAYNPFDQDIGRVDPAAELVGTGIVGRRFVEAGPRFLARNVATFFVRSQFDGAFDFADNLFSWDAGYSHGQNDNTNKHRGDLDMTRVQKALGPSSGCPSAENPDCVPLNLFGGPGTITPEMLDYITYEATSSARYVVQDVYANLSTEVDWLSGVLPNDILSAPIGLAMGAEYREESFTESPDPYTVQGTSSTNLRQPTLGAYNVKEAYLELALPILSDKYLAQSLELSVAGRYTEYNTFDPKTTGKLGMRWKPIDDLLVRATASQAFRAPNLTELFLGSADGYPLINDPCVTSATTGSRPSGTDVDANCDAENVPDDVASPTGGQVLARTRGNRDLQPEVADTLTAGFVYSPAQLPDFNVFVDYFQIKLDDYINFLDPQYILDTCFTRPAGTARPQLCDFVHREPVDPATGGGRLSYIDSLSYNFAKLETAGVDIGFDWVLPLGSWIPAMSEWGRFRLSYDSQYLERYDQFVPDAAGNDIPTGITSNDTGLAGRDPGDNPLPRYKANATLEWAMSNFKASWTTRYIGGVKEACSDGQDPPLQTYGLCSDPDTAYLDPALTDDVDDSTNEIPSTIYHNVQFGYSIPQWNADLTVGVNNVLDKDPPLSQAAFANGFAATLYEIPQSRQPYLRLKVSF